MARKKKGPTRKRNEALAARRERTAGDPAMDQFSYALQLRRAEIDLQRENAVKRQWSEWRERPPDHVMPDIMAIDDEPIITRTERRVAKKWDS